MRLVTSRGSPRLRPGGLLKTLLVAVLGIAVVAAIVSTQNTKKQKEALTEADRLYASKPAEAVAKYKEGYPSAEDRKAEVLQKIVDHEVENGSTAEAERWVARGLDDKVIVAYKSAAGRALVAKVEKDRAEKEVAKKAEELAKRAERDAKAKQRDEDKGVRDQIKTNKNLPREQFRALVNGRTKQQVIEALGKPNSTQDDQNVGELWYYENVAVDPVTGKKNALVQLVFDGAVVTSVNFN